MQLEKKEVKVPLLDRNSLCGGVAHLVERQLCKLDVAGSSPVTSTIYSQSVFSSHANVLRLFPTLRGITILQCLISDCEYSIPPTKCNHS